MSSSSIFPERISWRCLLWRWLPAAVAICTIPASHALDPNRAPGQYKRDRWSSEQGFPGGTVNAIAEAEGYLWIGAGNGLVRFDGVSFRIYNHATSSLFPPGPVLGLNTDAEGSLWIRMQGMGLLRYRNGTFQEMLADRLPNEGVTAMGQGLRGDILLARSGDPVRYRGEKIEHIAPGVWETGRLVISVAEAADGAIWMGTRDAGLFSLRDGRAFAAAGLPDRKVNCLLAGDGPELWIGTDNGLVRWNGREITRMGVPPPIFHTQILAITRDREANIWVGTSSGLVRFNAHGFSNAERGDGRKAGPVNALFEDREGSLWVGEAQGIERYRDSAFLTYSPDAGPLYVDGSGRTWFGPSRGGLSWLHDGQSGRIEEDGLKVDVVYSIDGGPGELWVGRQRGGLTRVRDQNGLFSAETFTSSNGLAPGSVYALHRNRDGAVWAATLGGGVSVFRGGHITTYTVANGLASNTVSAIEEGADGTMWFATPNGLNALAQDHWRTYTSQDGLPPGRVNCLTEDTAGVLWIGTDAGLAFLRDGRVYTPQDLPDSLLDEVLGIAADARGSIWIATAKHVVRASRTHLLGERPALGDLREFGAADGLPETEGVRRHRSVTIDHSGRVWFALHSGIAVVDPARLIDRSAPAIVHIQSVSADGSPLNVAAPLRIPSARQRITFGYVGLSLAVPERIRFRYRLDPFDRDWSEPVATRESVYTNLGPGSYRFRVVASNSEGIWNGTETAIPVEVTPAAWQTWWFRLSAVGACLLGILAMYRLHLHQLTSQLNVRFEERLAERTRIAQELHDTLLQGLLSASMQLHIAVDGVPADLPARRQLGRVLEVMQHVVDEGRNAVRGLRASGGGVDDLEQTFCRLRDERFIPEFIEFRVIVEGRSRALIPLIRDELYRIGREALMNAFQHSGAANVEIELGYAPREMRLLVRDNGCGIDPGVLRSGREGHWGLVGMRERAERIGGRLKVWSRADAGTEVELTVPGHIAYPHQNSSGPQSWLSRWRRGKTPVETSVTSTERDQ